MRAFLRILLAAFVVGGVLGPISSAHASFHEVRITEVFLGTGGASTAQFVELTAFSNNQHLVSGTIVRFYNDQGDPVESATFSGSSDADVKGEAMLVATTAAETFFGVTADLEFDTVELSQAGKVCFLSSSQSPVDCVSWGGFAGPATGAGDPAIPSEGIPSGASILRDESGGTDPDAFDFLDDTGDSRDDFRMATTNPNGGGPQGQTLQRIGFQGNAFSVEEGETAGADIVRIGPTTGIKAYQFSTANGTAKAAEDYQSVSQNAQFNASQTQAVGTVPTLEDTVFEGDETVKLRIRNPQAGAVLGSFMNATLTISDVEDDSTAPKSRITKPEHGGTYARDNLTKIKGTADDGPGTVQTVIVGLRRTFTNGTCEHLTGSGSWQAGPCAGAVYMEATGTTNWALPIDPLKRSVGTNIKNYRAVSLASDDQHNVESVLKRGRNKNTFEVN